MSVPDNLSLCNLFNCLKPTKYIVRITYTDVRKRDSGLAEVQWLCEYDADWMEKFAKKRKDAITEFYMCEVNIVEL